MATAHLPTTAKGGCRTQGLPPAFWDTRTCPEFIPPAGVFRFIYWLPFTIEFDDGETMPEAVGIRRSAGWIVLGGELYELPEDDRFDSEHELVWPPGKEVPKHAVSNLRWRTLRSSWNEAWHVRRRQLRAVGTDLRTLPESEATERRDRRAILRRYHEEGWAPCDFPAWFFDAEECPPFEPPNETYLLDYGEASVDLQTGELGTWIRCTGFYNWVLGPNTLEFQPRNEHVEWVPGGFTEGAIPAKYEREAHAYRAAQQEWAAEFQRRTRMRRGED